MIEAIPVEFSGLLAATQLRGQHSRPWNRTITSLQIAVDGSPPSTANAVFQITIGGVAQAQQFVLPIGQTFIEIAASGNGLAIAANAVAAAFCLTPGGASDLTVTFFSQQSVEDGVPSGPTTYIDVSDLCPSRIPKLKLLQLVDDDKLGLDGNGDFQAAHVAIIQQAIIDAENEAEGLASKRYAVAALRSNRPPAFIVKIKDLAEVNLFRRRPPLYPAHEQLRETAIAWLNSLKTGNDALGLDVPVAEKPAAAGGHAASISGPPTRMDSKSLEGF